MVGVISTVKTTTSNGLLIVPIDVEVDISPSLPSIVIVGLADKAVSESKERIRSGIKQSGYDFPLGKVTVNLAPADVAKSGSGFDLAIALGILAHSGVIPQNKLANSLFVGELSLDGQIRKVPGVLSICKWARTNSISKVFIPHANSAEASLIEGVEIYPIKNLVEAVNHLNGNLMIPVLEYRASSGHESSQDLQSTVDFKHIQGQAVAKRALELAAGGNHNILMIGEPGSGKTLLSRALFGILPDLSNEEVVEIMEIYSLSGKLKENTIINTRPFRSPHHSSSHVSLVGGGSKLMPGEITLAHRGVLFLDEFPEFSRMTLEALRQPLEEGFIDISRASGSVRYPSKFMLVAAANPTPSGFHENNSMGSLGAVRRYQQKFSGPIIDRIDMHLDVNRPNTDELMSKQEGEPSCEIKKRVDAVRVIQRQRFETLKLPYLTNNEIRSSHIGVVCKATKEGEEFLRSAIEKLKISGRGYHKLLRLSRTIADFEGHELIELNDIMESLQYRSKVFSPKLA